jgi:hypothetical protein
VVPHASRYAMALLASLMPAFACERQATGGMSLDQPERKAVIAVVESLLEAIGTRDTALAGQVLLPGAALVAVGESGVRRTTDVEFAGMLSQPGEVLLERIWSPEVQIEGPIAAVWAPYDFHRGGAFSHCGIDAFHLAKAEGQWRITSVIYTVQREGCPPSPLGAPDSGPGAAAQATPS